MEMTSTWALGNEQIHLTSTDEEVDDRLDTLQSLAFSAQKINDVQKSLPYISDYINRMPTDILQQAVKEVIFD